MSSVTEIYVCKLGQELKKGKLFTSKDIHTRQEAEVDARERCGFNDSIAKVAYYAIQDDGNFKSILIYENPDVDLSRFSSNTLPENSSESGAKTRTPASSDFKSGNSLFSRLVMFFTEEAG